MSTSVMSYEGYSAKIQYDDEDRLFYGDVIDLRDTITFFGESVAELEAAFHETVDGYLEWCAERQVDPEKPFSGKVQLRLDPAQHRKAAITAAGLDCSLNEVFLRAISDYLDRVESETNAP